MLIFLIYLSSVSCVNLCYLKNLDNKLPGFHTFKSLRTLQRFNVPPRGSKIESDINRLLSDPLNTSPWEYQSPFSKSFTKEQNLPYGLLKNDWGYLNHSEDAAQPAGVIEGGRENYKGKGLKLEGGKDRQRLERRPYYLDHGNEWRQRKLPGTVSFAISPDANQDYCLYETELDLERRQWGSWSQPRTSFFMPSAWRSKVKLENPTDAIYPWLYPYKFIEMLPLFEKKTVYFLPDPDPDCIFAAYNLFEGFLPIQEDRAEISLVKQKRLLEEWKRLEDEYKTNNDESILNRIEQIKKLLFNMPEFTDADPYMLRLLAEVAIIRAREMLTMQANDKSQDPEIIEGYLKRISGLDSKDMNGECKYTGPEKTVVLNLVNYRPISDTFKHYTTVEEMAESYHELVTEIRGEGRIHTHAELVTLDHYKDYMLRSERKKFPSVYNEYKPIWTHRKYGPEFGDALRKSQKIPEDELVEFDRPLRKRKRRMTKRERKMNYVDDYDYYNQEYDY